MHSVVDDGTSTLVVPDGIDDRFMRAGEILSFHRQHLPTRRVSEAAEPEGPSWCRLVRQRDVRQFALTGPETWIDYEAVSRHFEEMRARGTSTHIVPYRREEVFAPVKIVFAERDRPIRAALTYEPVYPARGKLGLLRPGKTLAAAYAATAVFNSSLGQALYQRLLQEWEGAESSPSGLSRKVLERMPVAARSYQPDQLQLVATLSYQIITLYEAERECRMLFTEAITRLRERLGIEICRLLDLAEHEVESLEREAAGLGLPDLPRPNLLRTSHDLLPLEPVRLEPGPRLRGDDRPESERRRLVEYWGELLTAPQPFDICLPAEPEAAVHRSGAPPSPDSPEDGRGPGSLPIGRHIVAVPGVCGGRPIVKHTRIDARWILHALQRGDSPEAIVSRYGGRVSREAVQEVRELAEQYDAGFFEQRFVPADRAA